MHNCVYLSTFYAQIVQRYEGLESNVTLARDHLTGDTTVVDTVKMLCVEHFLEHFISYGLISMQSWRRAGGAGVSGRHSANY
jgi:hypothetical protein